MGKGAEANKKLRKLGKEGPTKHPDTPEGGAWGCGMFDPPPSSRGQDKRWFNEHGEIFSWRNFWGSGGLYMGFVVYVIPLDLMGLFYWGCTVREVAKGFLVWYVLASFALTMNHRYFSHAAFKTSRPWRFVLACTTLLGMQFGPIWWSSKHRLHHKFCDSPADPHSWKQTSFFYAWIGWFHGHKEQGIDVAYVHPSFLEDEPLFDLPSCLIPLHSFGERGSPEYVEGGERRMRPKNGTGKEKVIGEQCKNAPNAASFPYYCWSKVAIFTPVLIHFGGKLAETGITRVLALHNLVATFLPSFLPGIFITKSAGIPTHNRIFHASVNGLLRVKQRRSYCWSVGSGSCPSC